MGGAASTYPGAHESNRASSGDNVASVVNIHSDNNNRRGSRDSRTHNNSARVVRANEWRNNLRNALQEASQLNQQRGNRQSSSRRLHSYPGQGHSQQLSQSPTQPQNRRFATTDQKPGAFGITPIPAGTPGTILRVMVPHGVRPGQEFQCQAGTRMVRVRCPFHIGPRRLLDITVPPEPIVSAPASTAILTPLENRRDEESSNHAESDSIGATKHDELSSNLNSMDEDIDPNNSPGVSRLPNQDPNSPITYQVTVPYGIRPGQQFFVTIQNQKLAVTCPSNSHGGEYVRVIPPRQINHNTNTNNNTSLPSSNTASSNANGNSNGNTNTIATTPDMDHSSSESQSHRQFLARQASRPQLQMQMFEVVVPMNVRSGQPFTLEAAGQRVLVTCPPTAGPGQRIRFQLPIPVNNTPPPSTTYNNNNHVSSSNSSNSLTQNTDTTNNARKKQNNSKPINNRKPPPSIKLNYDTKDGWTRTIRLDDYKFQWIRTQSSGQVHLHHNRFDIHTSAYVRKLMFREGNDPRMRTGHLSLVPASDAVVASSVSTPIGIAGPKKELVSYADIASAQTQQFKEKVLWFQDMCRLLKMDWNLGHMRIQVRRNYLLDDSLQAVMSLGREDLRKIWRFEFLGEQGVDAGGLAREWYQVVTEELFNADRGLWSSNEGNQMCMQINSASEMNCGEDHLVYFRFLGRVMGKALFDQHLISAHMVRHLYKHILGWPLTFQDLELIDEQYYLNMQKLTKYSNEELEMLCLDFTYTEQNMGISKEIELKKNGKSIDVTHENLPEYLEACTKYRLMGRVKPQLTELLLGFFDIIPEPLLTVFDFQELELLMCGLPEVDMEDWKANTEYLGTVATKGKTHPVVKWFWEVVEEDFDQALKAKLLQFVTGTSGVPSRGFSVLQGNDGDIRKFSIQGVSLGTLLFPRSHTCFNRIDLPMYKTKKDLREKLKLVVQIEPTGFTIE